MGLKFHLRLRGQVGFGCILYINKQIVCLFVDIKDRKQFEKAILFVCCGEIMNLF